MTKTSPIQFIREARQELSRVVWPSRKETTTTTIMVLIMTLLAAIFFLCADVVMSSAIDWFLGLGV